MADLATLNAQKNGIVGNINSLKTQIAYYKKQRDSLARFRKIAEEDRDDFETINGRKILKLDNLAVANMITSHCRTEKVFYRGMLGDLDGLGSKTVGAAFRMMLFKMELKKNEYNGKITALEIKLAAQQLALTAKNQEISDAEKEND